MKHCNLSFNQGFKNQQAKKLRQKFYKALSESSATPKEKEELIKLFRQNVGLN